jgi:GxxExxY protein
LRGVKFEAQRVVEICYADHYVGDCNVDLVVGGLVVVELKAAGQQVAAPDRQQIEKYLRLMGLKHGLLINFAKSGRAKRAKEPADKPEITVIELP